MFIKCKVFKFLSDKIDEGVIIPLIFTREISMSGYINRATIMGRLGADPELKYTNSGTPVCNLSVATNHFNKALGEQETEWHKVVVWGKHAENCSRYLSKGKRVLVEGRLKTTSWHDRNDETRWSTQIVASSVHFIDSNASSEEGEDEGTRGETATLEDIPF